MKTKLWMLVALPVLVLMNTGCNNPLRLKIQLLPYAPVTSFCGHGMNVSQVVRSEAELFGNDNEVVLVRGSYVPKLSILGHNNRIIVEEGAAVARVEMAGEGNEVRTAQGMPVILTQFGHSSRFEGTVITAPGGPPR